MYGKKSGLDVNEDSPRVIPNNVTPSIVVLKPAVAIGVPVPNARFMMPPALCSNTIAPALLMLALTYGTAAALTAETKSAAVVPTSVAVTGVEKVATPGAVAEIVNVATEFTTEISVIEPDQVVQTGSDQNEVPQWVRQPRLDLARKSSGNVGYPLHRVDA